MNILLHFKTVFTKNLKIVIYAYSSISIIIVGLNEV